METQILTSNRWRQRGLIFGGWTLLVLIFATQSYLYLTAKCEPVTWPSVLLWAMSEWYTWAALSPFILWLARRFRIERQNWLRHLGIHVLAALCFAALQPVLQATIKYAGLGGDLTARPFTTILNQLLLTKYHLNLLIYAAIIGISHAAEFYRRYREREQNLSQLETLLAQAQLSALRMQLQPHFLFNALNSLADLIERDSKAANKMVARLGDFLRLTLHRSDTQEVTLAEEIEFLLHYLDVEKLRFEDRLRVEMDIAPETDLALIPHLILQPLVENSIRHGIAQLETKGSLEIRAWRKAETLCLQVRDNGPGLVNGNQNGVGLRNTQARLQKLYGARQRFEMRNVPAGGVEVTLQIPFVESTA